MVGSYNPKTKAHKVTLNVSDVVEALKEQTTLVVKIRTHRNTGRTSPHLVNIDDPEKTVDDPRSGVTWKQGDLILDLIDFYLGVELEEIQETEVDQWKYTPDQIRRALKDEFTARDLCIVATKKYGPNPFGCLRSAQLIGRVMTKLADRGILGSRKEGIQAAIYSRKNAGVRLT